jgi:hypothetical protein
MRDKNKQQVEEFLGVRILTPLEEKVVSGAVNNQTGDHGTDHDHDGIFGDHHDHG